MKRLAKQASGLLPRTKRTKLQKEEEQLRTSTVENDLLYDDPPVDSNGEFLHNNSNGDSLLGFGFNFDENDNKENDYSNFSKCKAYILLINSYHNCYIINYFFNL